MSTDIENLNAFLALQEYGSYSAAGKVLGLDYRTVKTRVNKYQQHPEAVLYRNALETRTDANDVNFYWVKTDEVSMMVRRDKQTMSYAEIRDNLIAEMKEYAPKYEKIEYPNQGEHMLVVDPADIHIGKLCAVDETGYKYDMSIGVERMRTGISELAAKAAVFGVKSVVFVIGNDIIHIDNPRRTTTSGTPQDTQGQWWEMFYEAKKAYIAAIEQLSLIAPVTVVYCPSNHDFTAGFYLADTIHSWFANNPNVTFGQDQKCISINHRKFVSFGNNLMMFTHGDGAKEKDLASILQYEAREAWGKTKYAYVYVHHYHHKIRKAVGMDKQNLEKDHIGVTVIETGRKLDPEMNVYIEYVRSPSPPDGWHHRNGYVNTQAIEVFLHHPDYGQAARFTHFF